MPTAPPDLHTLPRVYTDAPLAPGAVLPLAPGQARHLRGALRLRDGAMVRAFNGREGEWLARLESSSLVADRQVRSQPARAPGPALLFAPIKRERCAALVEKAVELGATDLAPVRTARTLGQASATLTPERLTAWALGAAEQSERLLQPALHAPASLHAAVARWSQRPGPLYVCLERREAGSVPYIGSVALSTPCAFLIGPEGGFDAAELAFLERLAADHPNVRALWLGPEVLRSETAAALCLAGVKLRTQP
ncbi:MAG: 16S rRNA (uracil(1498)-N(3))-methyltransferase [Alphaproteobacteria bacterium]|jgi:16S rRNA (uracil1498-N3)-methyltransferase|nr:16S rRNA (uracil(1498)-N(3))-methyltransferase [Alphaproteobacteria bacterium]